VMWTMSEFILVAVASFTRLEKAGSSPLPISMICITDHVSPALGAFGDVLATLCLLRPSFFIAPSQG
jgi:hypothetical protein